MPRKSGNNSLCARPNQPLFALQPRSTVAVHLCFGGSYQSARKKSSRRHSSPYLCSPSCRRSRADWTSASTDCVPASATLRATSSLWTISRYRASAESCISRTVASASVRNRFEGGWVMMASVSDSRKLTLVAGERDTRSKSNHLNQKVIRLLDTSFLGKEGKNLNAFYTSNKPCKRTTAAMQNLIIPSRAFRPAASSSRAAARQTRVHHQQTPAPSFR
jgi:hypothetical protein